MVKLKKKDQDSLQSFDHMDRTIYIGIVYQTPSIKMWRKYLDCQTFQNEFQIKILDYRGIIESSKYMKYIF